MTTPISLAKSEREILKDLADGDARSMVELAAGRSYLTTFLAVKRLEARGLIVTWLDRQEQPNKPRRIAQATKATLTTING